MYFTPQHEFETSSQSKCFLLLFFIILRLRHNFSCQKEEVAECLHHDMMDKRFHFLSSLLK